MQRRRSLTLFFITAVMAGSLNVWAHEECDEPKMNDHSSKPLAQDREQPAAGARVVVKLFQYQPERLQVNAGTTVTWVNDDEIFHSVTVDGKEKSFDAPLDGKGKSISFTFSKPGLYTYYCDRHEHMRGEIEVR